ncbi:hypothetical protein AK812_SmicGene19129 [Symbiodinium microadriaticum]|uniref:Uncharacterized protein n=2 Tax=Symbiodinium TaxID=2949 RepID=A0A1Q9DTB4_SYMMI|nr:hypothetical protein AK812_SmicGene19129 [Symbiodinium microadriaticum]
MSLGRLDRAGSLLLSTEEGSQGARSSQRQSLVQSIVEAARLSLDPAPGAVDKTAVWGLYCMYAIVGLIYGFVSNYINIPICQYVFGPLGTVGRASVQQCNISVSLTQMPWNFKSCLIRVILACMSVLAQNLADEGNFAVYMMLLVVMCFFYIFADVAGDGMTIELSKLEPPETRGYILTTGQMVRFATTTLTNVLGILAMNGKYYYPPQREGDTNDTIFSFELSFWQVHLVLVCMALPFWGFMVYLLQDPPQQVVLMHSPQDVIKEMWKVMKTKVMFYLILFALGNMAIASLLNPAQNIIAFIAAPSTLQNSVGTFAGNAMFLIGVFLFRRYFMTRNWRMTFVWTAMILALNNCFQLMVIYNAWGIGQDGWFYAFGSNILMVIQGIAQVLSSLAVVEISPAGYEASVYEFLTSIHNAGITLNSNLQNLFVPIFHLNGIAQAYFPTPSDPSPPQSEFNADMARATYFTMIVNLAGALTFCWFLPKQKEQCRKWAEDPVWRRPVVGTVNVVLGGGVLLFSIVVSLLSAFPSTNCLKIAGGSGC